MHNRKCMLKLQRRQNCSLFHWHQRNVHAKPENFGETKLHSTTNMPKLSTFWGIQIFASRDFYQLPPVPSVYDEGKYCFQNEELWSSLFPHTVKLTAVVQQQNEQFIKALNSVSLGQLMKTASLLVKSL